MIELINVSKYYPTEFGRHYVLRNVSLKLPLDKSIGVLGVNGSGKSTLLRLLGGSDIPSEGKIIKTGLISPPMGLTPGIQSNLTAAENARFAGRIYGLDRSEIEDLIKYVQEIANIGKFFDMPINTYSAGMRQRIGFAINMSLTYDYYLFDEIGAGGDKEFRKISRQMVKDRLRTSKFIMTSHAVDELLEICNAGIVIQNGDLKYFDDIKDAVIFYGDTDGLTERQQKRLRRKEKYTAMAAGEGQGEGSLSGLSGQGKKERRQHRKFLRRAAQLSQGKANAGAAPGIAGAAFDPYLLPDDGGLKNLAQSADRIAERKARVMARRQKRLANQSQTGELQLKVSPAPANLEKAENVPSPEAAALRADGNKQNVEAETARKTGPVSDPDAGGMPDVVIDGAAETALASKFEKRRARTIARRQARSAGDENAVTPSIGTGEPLPEPDGPDLEDNGAAVAGVDDKVSLRRERRRQRRLEWKSAALLQDGSNPSLSEGVAAPEAEEALASETGSSRRDLRRQKRKARKEERPDAEAASAIEAAPDRVDVVTEAPSVPASSNVETAAKTQTIVPPPPGLGQRRFPAPLERQSLSLLKMQQSLACDRSAYALSLLLRHLDDKAKERTAIPAALPINAQEAARLQSMKCWTSLEKILDSSSEAAKTSPGILSFPFRPGAAPPAPGRTPPNAGNAKPRYK